MNVIALVLMDVGMAVTAFVILWRKTPVETDPLYRTIDRNLTFTEAALSAAALNVAILVGRSFL